MKLQACVMGRGVRPSPQAFCRGRWRHRLFFSGEEVSAVNSLFLITSAFSTVGDSQKATKHNRNKKIKNTMGKASTSDSDSENENVMSFFFFLNMQVGHQARRCQFGEGSTCTGNHHIWTITLFELATRISHLAPLQPYFNIDLLCEH